MNKIVYTERVESHLHKAIALSLLMSCWLCVNALAQNAGPDPGNGDDLPTLDGVASPVGTLLHSAHSAG